MTEDDARDWIGTRYPHAIELVARFLAMVVDENERQNLIAPSTIATIWSRHAVDSAQLLLFDRIGETWLDIGSGGGFPGIVVALLRSGPTVLVEPRAKRAAFLSHCLSELAISDAWVVCDRVERCNVSAGVISARAVASLSKLFASATHCAGPQTRWLLPKGRAASDDLADARDQWTGMFHVEQSLVELDSKIIVAEGLRRR